MADKRYVAVFMLPEVREAIKNKAKENNRTIMGQLAEDYT